jgi:RNA recognition motif-containing protein
MRSEAPMAATGASEDRTLYVGNLPYDTSQQELTQFLTDLGVGPVARIHLPTGPDGRMRGFGFVTLGTADAAQAALSVLNNADIRGRRLMINIAHPRGASPSTPPGADRSRAPSGMGGAPRYPTEPPMSFESGGGGGAREGGRTAPPAEGDWADRPKKKKVKGATPGRERPGDERKRGGGSSWRSLADSDDED